MTKIHLTKTHKKNNEEIEAMVSKLEDTVFRDYQMKAKRSGNQLRFARPGLDGTLTLGDQKVDIDIKLGMMNRLFAPTIEAALRKKLDEYLA